MPEQIGILGGTFIRELSLGLSSPTGVTGTPLGGAVNLSIFPNLTGITAPSNGVTGLTGTTVTPLLQTLRFENNYLTKENLEDVVTGIYANRNSITGAANKIVNFNLTGAQMGTIDRTIRINNVNKYQAEIDKLGFNVGYNVNGERDQRWVGSGANNNFSTASNWANGVSPVEYDALYFGGTTRLGGFNDFPIDTQLNGAIFNSGAGAFNLSGNRFILTYGGIVNNSTNTQTINTDILLSGTRRAINCSSGPIVLGRNIGGSGNLTKIGAGNLFLSGNNTYTGDTFINNGAVGVLNSNPFGTGNVYLQTPSPDWAPAIAIAQTAIPATIVINNPIYSSYVAGVGTLGIVTANKSTRFNGPIIFVSGGLPLTLNQNVAMTIGSASTVTFNGGISGASIWSSTLVNIQGGTNTTAILTGSPVVFNNAGVNFGFLGVTTGIIAVSGNRFQTLRVINGSNVRCDVPLAINNDNITFNATSTNTINLNGNNQIFKNIVSAGRNCNIFNNSPTAANLILNPTFPPTYLGGISGNINLIKSGVAFLGISGSLTGGLGAQVYTGSTTVTGGALVTYTPFSDPLARITSGVLGSSTSLVVGFRSSPANGESFRLLPGSTVNNYSIITLQGSAAGRTATYNGANSTLTLTN